MNEKKWKILSRIESSLIALTFAIIKASAKHRLPLIKKTEDHNGQIFLLGNGPSFATDYKRFATQLHTQSKMAVNFFAKSPLFTEIKPNWYILADGVFFEAKENLSDHYFALQQEMVALLNEQVTWPMTLILPSEAQKNLSNLGLQNPHIRFVFFNSNKADAKVFGWLKSFLWKKNWASVTKMNVLISATYCAINLGFKKLILLGADHSWSENFRIDAQNRAYMFDPHFYDNNNDHKEPTYLYQNANSKKSLKAQQFFQGLANVFEAYDELNTYAQINNATIVNGSSNSFIDTFERI